MAVVDLATKLEIITDYYGVGTIWDKMDINGLSTDQINAMYNSLPASSFTVDRTPSGLNLGRNYNNPFELPVTPGTDFDSNIPGGSYGGGNTFSGQIPANLETDPNTGLPVRQTAGAIDNVGNMVATIADRVSLAVTGVNIGAKLGMAIDSGLYAISPHWWDEHLPTVNPETWNTLVGVNPVGDFFLRTLFGISNDMEGYISEDVLAYYYQMLRDNGAFGSENSQVDSYTPKNTNWNLSNPGEWSFPVKVSKTNTVSILRNSTLWTATASGADTYVIAIHNHNNSTGFSFVSDRYFTVRTNDTTYTPNSVTIDGHTYYVKVSMLGNRGNKVNTSSIPVNNFYNDPTNLSDYVKVVFNQPINFGGIDGISQMTGSTYYPPTNITGTTPQQVKEQLKQYYPDLFTDSIKEKTLQDDGTVTETTYVPIPWATTGIDGDEKTTDEDKTQTTTQVDPETASQILPQTQQDEPTQPPETGEGETPVPVVPTGSASSLWAVYNPSQGELNSFGAWLWNSNFVEQLKKLFADPMQAIIGIHKVFATPQTGGSQTIKCGYLDSGVSASVVTNQYTTVDCGSASLREYFGNVFDYDPFTKVYIFLPFIGVVPLNTADVMRSTISVKYKVDVITGACLAEVSVSRDGGGGILYTYGGSAIVTYPISSGSYVGAVQAALSTAIGIGSAIATGGASLGASAGMVLGGLSHAKTQVQHSGQFSGCSGAMGGKKPYLIISRPQTRTPSKIAEFEGIPSNSIHQLSSCEGFTKVKEVHIMSKTAYDNEIQEIESLLKTGVIF